MSIGDLIVRAQQELDEVKEAGLAYNILFSDGKMQLKRECADVANFMMMVVDNIDGRHELEQKEYEKLREAQE